MTLPFANISSPLEICTSRNLLFGAGKRQVLGRMLAEQGKKSALVLFTEPMKEAVAGIREDLQEHGIHSEADAGISGEPGVQDFIKLCAGKNFEKTDTIIAIGGGSVLDAGKLAAVCGDRPEGLRELFGKDLVKSRPRYLVCLPTTAGAGSEASPNALFIDEESGSKKAVISPLLVPDVALLDPELAMSLPAPLTAQTGFDALCHCIEAYTNKHAHAFVDGFAIAGIRLIAGHIRRACENGNDLEARSALSLGSYLGGLCLGPVNTAGVHALSYPLGTIFKMGHGLANALLLPHVMRFNLPADPAKFAAIAEAMGVPDSGYPEQTARAGLEHIIQLCRDCGLTEGLDTYGVREHHLGELSRQAMEITRLLNNNPRRIDEKSAIQIYKEALHAHELKETV